MSAVRATFSLACLALGLHGGLAECAQVAAARAWSACTAMWQSFRKVR